MKPKAYLTVVSTIYHQPIAGQPSGVPRRSSLPLDDDMPPYIKRIVDLGEEWQDIECGWIPDPSFIEVFNEGTQYQRYPSDDEKLMAAGRIIEIGVGGIPAFLIRPLCAHSGEVVGKLQIRCRKGKASCTVTVWPR